MLLLFSIRPALFTETFSYSIGQFEALLPEVLAAPGPQFSALEIVAGEPYPRDYAYIHSAQARARFRAALNA